MPLEILDAVLSDFDRVFEGFDSAQRAQPALKFLLFLADKDPSTKLSWCPDCNVAEPVIYKKLEASNSNVVLLRAYVGDRPTWRNPSHPWRVDPRFKVKGVPTLIRWENGEVTKRLEDYEAHVEEKIESLLATK
ncbi:thioredoxin-like protein Clot [Curcuma longa]|uniref:thioredoxin-like protein Clot n=1 Tax=Curcuma longa TaxID=136217 RepID=UPI003D9DB829